MGTGAELPVTARRRAGAAKETALPSIAHGHFTGKAPAQGRLPAPRRRPAAPARPFPTGSSGAKRRRLSLTAPRPLLRVRPTPLRHPQGPLSVPSRLWRSSPRLH